MSTFFEKLFDFLDRTSKLNILGFLFFIGISKYFSITRQSIAIFIFSISVISLFTYFIGYLMNRKQLCSVQEMNGRYIIANIFIPLILLFCVNCIKFEEYKWVIKTWNLLFGDFIYLKLCHFQYAQVLFIYILEYLSLYLIFKNWARSFDKSNDYESSDLEHFLLLSFSYFVYSIFSQLI